MYPMTCKLRKDFHLIRSVFALCSNLDAKQKYIDYIEKNYGHFSTEATDFCLDVKQKCIDSVGK